MMEWWHWVLVALGLIAFALGLPFILIVIREYWVLLRDSATGKRS